MPNSKALRVTEEKRTPELEVMKPRREREGVKKGSDL